MWLVVRVLVPVLPAVQEHLVEHPFRPGWSAAYSQTHSGERDAPLLATTQHLRHITTSQYHFETDESRAFSKDTETVIGPLFLTISAVVL